MLKHFAWQKATMPEVFTDSAIAFYLGASELLTHQQFQDNAEAFCMEKGNNARGVHCHSILLKSIRSFKKSTIPRQFQDNAEAFCRAKGNNARGVY